MTHHHHEHHDHHHPKPTRDVSSGKQLTPEEMQERREQFEALINENFTREAAVLSQSGMDRRTFMKIMGASLAMAGFTMSGCASTDPPDGEIIPYVETPEEIIPGRPLFFASTMTLGGYATGLLIETHQGRPTRVEGNPNHPASLGGTSAIIQASLLELYNPDRAINVRKDGRLSDWESFLAELQPRIDEFGDGEGLRILTETVTSPTLAAQIDALLEQYPGARWYQYEPVAQDNVIDGARLAFGEDSNVNAVYDFQAANVVVSLDADFLNGMPGSLAYARDFMARRKVRVEDGDESEVTMNRLYVVESGPTLTGASADHRLSLRPGHVESFALALANALGVGIDAQPESTSWDSAWLDALVADLEANRGSSIVVAGPEQTPVVHALAHAINMTLENNGATVIYTPSPLARPVIEMDELTELISEIGDGDVDTLFILGGNPVYSAPADSNFAEVLNRVDFKVHLSHYNNETSALCDWLIPQTHYVEEWSDARAFDGTASLVQPPIGPLYDTVRSAHQIIALLANDERSSYDIVRDYWREQFDGDAFEPFWRRALHDGVIADSTPDPIQPTLAGGFADELAGRLLPAADGPDIIFRADPNIWDGRYAFNSWLQELPHPLTKVSWDMAAMLSPAMAESLGVENSDLIALTYADNTLNVPVWITPGHVDDAVTISLGYGRGISAELDDGYAFNAYTLRTSNAMWFARGAEITASAGSYPLAAIRSDLGVDESFKPIHAGTLAAFRENPESVHGEEEKQIGLLGEWEYNSYAWGMSIDLTACMGCNACMIACQMENNIPTVGKEGIARQREMYWIRVDRYYVQDEDDENADLHTFFQPVPCMQCENAPCEQVCPVHATVHSSEGLNDMVYNRCVGTRYCAANCPYSVRRFNFFDYVDDAPIMEEWRNPNVTVRSEGVMEKCTYCVQRINAARIDARNADRRIGANEVTPACAAACPTEAIIFGDLNNPESLVTQLKAQPHDYGLLAKLNTQPRTTFLAHLSNPNPALNGEVAQAEEE